MGAICCKCCQIKPISGLPEDLRSKIYSYLLQVTYKGHQSKIKKMIAVNPYVQPQLSYKRVTEFDSSYISVWDGPDPTNLSKPLRVIAVRGTQVRWRHPVRSYADVYEDVKVYAKGFPDDLIHGQMAAIMKATPKDLTIDVCAHSLGTSLVLETYMKTLSVEDRTRRTYLFNPIYTPFHHSGKMSEISRLFEDNMDCRWFLNTGDIVSVEGQDKMLGGRWPKNVTLNIGRQPPFLHINRNHSITQWNGRVEIKHPKCFVPPSQKPGYRPRSSWISTPAGRVSADQVTSPSDRRGKVQAGPARQLTASVAGSQAPRNSRVTSSSTQKVQKA